MYRNEGSEREMAAYIVIWEDKLLSAHDSSLGSTPDISHKYKMGYISKGVANTL